MQSTLTALIDAAAVLGIFMVGALIASMIGVEVSWTPHIGDKAIEFKICSTLSSHVWYQLSSQV